MHKNLLKAKEILEDSLECIVKDTCPEKATKADVCLITEIVEGIHNINKIIVDDVMRINLYNKLEMLKEIRDVDELIDMYEEFMMDREKEGYSYQKEKDRRYKGGAY